jgi:hypothetical protein
MTNKEYLEKNLLPVVDIDQIQELFAEFILWYDEAYCKNIEGANEIVGEYFDIKQLK